MELLGRREGVARGSKATDSLLFLLRLNRFPGMNIYFLYALKTILETFNSCFYKCHQLHFFCWEESPQSSSCHHS